MNKKSKHKAAVNAALIPAACPHLLALQAIGARYSRAITASPSTFLPINHMGIVRAATVNIPRRLLANIFGESLILFMVLFLLRSAAAYYLCSLCFVISIHPMPGYS
jgi:F0F1-type ATP synthase membrane subunit a